MATNHRSELIRVVIHQAPTRPMMFLGGERSLMIASMIFCGYMAYLLTFRFNFFIGVGVAGAVWLLLSFILRKMATADSQMWEVSKRHMRYKSFYPAKGRFNATLPIIRDFK